MYLCCPSEGKINHIARLKKRKETGRDTAGTRREEAADRTGQCRKLGPQWAATVAEARAVPSRSCDSDPAPRGPASNDRLGPWLSSCSDVAGTRWLRGWKKSWGEKEPRLEPSVSRQQKLPVNCAQVSSDLGCIRKLGHSSQNAKCKGEALCWQLSVKQDFGAHSSIVFFGGLGELKNFLMEASRPYATPPPKCTQFPKCRCCFLFQPHCEAYGILM